MRGSIDRAGRVVVPKPLREGLKLTPGTVLEIRSEDGLLVMEPAASPMHLEREDGVLVAVPEQPVPALTARQVRETLESVRR